MCVALVIVASLVDYIVRASDRGLRIMLSAALGLAISAVVLRLGKWWRHERRTDQSAAHALQAAFPVLGDRVASALEFLGQEEDDPTAGSAVLRRAVVADATATLDELPTEQVADRHGVPQAVTAALLAIAVVLAMCMLLPKATRTALVRLVAPWSDVEWPRRNDLEFIDTPDLVARGSAFEASLVDANGELPTEVAIEYRYEVDDGLRTEKAWMRRVGDTMLARRENVRRPFEFRATGGDHHSMPWRKVSVVDRPTAGDLSFAIQPPAYSGLPTVAATDALRVLAGSSIGLSATANQPLANALLDVGSSSPVDVELDEQLIRLSKDRWIPAADGSSRIIRPKLRMVSTTSVEGTLDLPPVEIVADRVPEVSWVSPTEDLYLTAGALVPIEVVTTDDLALAAVELSVDVAASDNGSSSSHTEEVLFKGPYLPPKREALPQEAAVLSTQTLASELDLTAMGLAAGDVLTLAVVATDYLPQTGVVAQPRRISIITAAELDSRLAGEQAEILRLLEQALADQRAAREQSSRAANFANSEQLVDRELLDTMIAAGLTQQGVRRTLAGADSGVLARTQAVLQQVTINRLQDGALVEQLKRIGDVVKNLRGGPLPAAEQQITDLRKRLEVRLGRKASPEGMPEFAVLDEQQQSIIEALEQLIDEASAWSNAERFARELARLEKEQRTLREKTLDVARRNLLAQSDRNVDPVEAAKIAQLATAQADFARRFDKLAQSMRQAANSDATASEFAERLRDALSTAEAMNLSARLAGAARKINAQQLGRAAETQQAAADGLRELIEQLRERAPKDPGELTSRLRDMLRQLAELQEQVRDTKQQTDASRQVEQRRDLEQQLSRAARELSRLTAEAASQSTSRASRSAAPKAGESRKQSQQALQQAQRDIEQAQRDLRQRIAELEGERQQRLLDRLAKVLEDLIPRQRQTLEQTLKLELIRETRGEFRDGEKQTAVELAEVEAQLGDELGEAIADVERRAVFQLALGGAADDMRQAARGLEALNTGRVTQALELSALTRMQHVLDILRDPPPAPQGDSSPGGQGDGNQPQRPPLIELAEVKMLRWLQLDLNGRTRLFEADIADETSEAAQKHEVARRLSSEQRRLEELVREMMRRNNRSVQPPIAL